MPELVALAITLAAWIFPFLVITALILLIKGMKRSDDAPVEERRRAFAMSMLVLAGLVLTAWPFCEVILWPVVMRVASG